MTQANRAEPGALSRLVEDRSEFLSERWGRRPVLRRKADGDGFRDLLSLEDVDTLLTTTSPRPPAFRMVKGGQALARSSYTRSGTVGGQRLSDLPDVGRVLEHFREGATLVLQGVHRWHAPVSRFCASLEAELTHPIQANAYITPPTAGGLDVHHDTHDVFVLQTSGRKHWKIYEPAVELALPSQRWSSDEHEHGELVIDTELEPGDVLYLPRGTPHVADTPSVASVHLTIGIRTVTWFDVVRRAVGSLDEVRELRDALPPGFADDPSTIVDDLKDALRRAADALAGLEPGQIADAEALRFWSARPPDLSGQLRELLDLDAVSDDTVVTVRPAATAVVRDGDAGQVRLVLGDRELTLPEAAGDAVRRILDAGSLRPADLSDLLDDGSRLVLVRRLVREGLLTTGAGADRA